MKLTPIPKLIKLAEKSFNKNIRQRDSTDGYFTCISCAQIKPISLMDAGHFIPVSKSNFLRFHKDNVHGECKGCNCFDRSHLVGYTLNLIKKIGHEKVQWLQNNRHTVKKWSRNELKEIINISVLFES